MLICVQDNNCARISVHADYIYMFPGTLGRGYSFVCSILHHASEIVPVLLCDIIPLFYCFVF